MIRDIVALRTLVAIADGGSFSSAAANLRISRAMASKHIADLEAELGVKLINRTTRRLSLTEAGQQLTAASRDMLDLLDTTEQDIRSSRDVPRGTLRISAPTSFGIRHLGSIISDYMTLYPEVEVELSLDDRVVDIVEQGFDLAIRIRRLEDSSLTARYLAPAHMALCASPEYLRRNGQPVLPQDLEQHSCLIYDYLASYGTWSMERDGQREHVRVNGRMRSNNGDVLMQAAAGGHGITLAPVFLLYEALKSGALVPVLRDWTVVAPSFYAVMPPGRVDVLKVRTFLDHLVTTLGKVPDWYRDVQDMLENGTPMAMK